MDKHEPPKVAPDDEDQLWIAPVLVAPRIKVSAPPGLTLSNTFSTLDDDDTSPPPSSTASSKENPKHSKMRRVNWSRTFNQTTAKRGDPGISTS